MAPTVSNKNKKLLAHLRHQEWLKKQKRIMSLLAMVTGTIALHMYPRFVKEKEHTSKLSGQDWVEELLEGHATPFYTAMGINKHVFLALLNELQQRCGLKNTKYVSAEEQLAIFLHMCRTGLSVAHFKIRFQCSGDTISKYVFESRLCVLCREMISLPNHRVIHCLLDMITSENFYAVYIKLPNENTPLSPFIRDNPKFYPFFKDCDGALDGTHINAHVPEESTARYRNRKGGLSQNVLAACSFELFFTYILSGWEGSAADSQVYDDARRTDFAIRPGKYYLADAGFPACDHLLVPYRGVRYHLKEWGRTAIRCVESSICIQFY